MPVLIALRSVSIKLQNFNKEKNRNKGQRAHALTTRVKPGNQAI